VIREAADDRLMLVVAVSVCVVASAVTLYPFIYVVSMSISDPFSVLSQTVWLLPQGLSFAGYELVVSDRWLWISYYNTLWYAVVGTSINVLLTVMTAYALSRPKFMIRKPLMFFIAFTMFFGGGFIPLFILVNKLGLYNTRGSVVLPTAMSAFYVIVARTFFMSTIPESLHESATLDGANEVTILRRLIVPLSKPVVAVLALFYAVGHWNSFFYAMLFLPDKRLQPLQLYIMNVLIQSSGGLQYLADWSDRGAMFIQLKYVVIVVAIVPIICVYPFIQRYFVRGAMIGALKG
jgi:putative aldouronate transport system permease protein